MKQRYLEVTYRKGQPLAAYLYLPRAVGTRCVRTQEVSSGLLVDFSESGDAIGLEILAPALVTVAQVNAALTTLGLPTLTSEELAPLKAA
ncbi:MAG: DUF2283 domain-containing protein [Nitrospiraceae bacterium]